MKTLVSRRWVRFALALAVLALGVGLYHWLSAPPEVRRLVWRPGQEYRYDFNWAVDTELHLPTGAPGAPPVTVSWDVAGLLTVRVLGGGQGEQQGGEQTLELSFPEVTRARFLLPSGELDGSRARELLEQGAARVVLGEDGAIRQLLSASEGAEASLVPRMVRAWANLVTLHPPERPAREWEATMSGVIGATRVAYSVIAESPLELDRRPLQYLELGQTGWPGAAEAEQKLGGATRFRLTDLGELDRLDAKETADIGEEVASRLSIDSELRLSLLSVGPAGPEVSPSRRWSPLSAAGAGVGAGVSEEQLLEQRIAGLTLESLETGFSVAAGGIDPTPKWLWQTTGFLRKYPEHCALLVDLATGEGTSPGRRALALDVLAATGHPTAQAAMRQILSGVQAAGGSDYAQLAQRFLQLEAPDAATLEYLEAELADSAGTEDERALINAVGGTAGALVRQGGPVAVQARETLNGLAARLDTTEEPLEQAALLLALGNSEDPGYATVVERQLTAGSEVVRLAAVRAAAHMPREQVEGALAATVRDLDPDVASQAVDALETLGASESVVRELAADVARGEVGANADSGLVRLFAKRGKPGPEIAAALRKILERNPRDSRLQARVRSALGNEEK